VTRLMISTEVRRFNVFFSFFLFPLRSLATNESALKSRTRSQFRFRLTNLRSESAKGALLVIQNNLTQNFSFAVYVKPSGRLIRARLFTVVRFEENLEINLSSFFVFSFFILSKLFFSPSS